jgi:cytochrome c peroxidase
MVGCGPNPPATNNPTNNASTNAATQNAGTNSGTNQQTIGPDEWAWDLPEGFPRPAVPEDNPMSKSKVELGRYLFYDKRLSGNEMQSCGSCHRQELAFTDGLATAEGSTGEIHPRGSMALGNIAYASILTWGNPLMKELEEQMLTPMFGEEPVELGLESQEQLLERLRNDEDYPEMFREAFGEPEDGELINLDRTTKAIASFQRSLITANSPYDRYTYYGEEDALTESQKRGMELFFSETLECFHCHGSFNFSDSVEHDGTVFEEVAFHNNGLYNIGGTGAYPPGNQGVYDVTGVLDDTGRFKAPSLRNIAVTGPYMHDGSIETLEEVIDHYARGGRLIEEGEYAGDGKENPFKSELVTGFAITEQEKQDVINFLDALTDEEFLSNPNYSDPYE